MSRAVSQKSPHEAASFCPRIPHFTTSASPRSISYSLAHSNIAPLLHAKLTPQVLLYLLTDTCSLKMIPSPAASIAACSGGVLDSIIKLKKRRQSEGMGRTRRKGEKKKKSKERSLTGQRRIIESWGSYQGRGEWACRLTADQRAPPAGTPAHEAGRAEPRSPAAWWAAAPLNCSNSTSTPQRVTVSGTQVIHLRKQRWEVTNYTYSSAITTNESLQLLYTYSATHIFTFRLRDKGAAFRN